MTDSDSHEPFDGEGVADEGPDLIVCPQCAHPNLIFRTHCRKCGGRLVGTSNLIPGAELVEWSPTDGPRGQLHNAAPLRVLVMLAGCIGVIMTGYAIQAGSSVALVMSLTPVIAAAVIYTRIRSIEANQIDSNEDAPSDSESCTECGSPVLEYDDICASCGALTAVHDSETNSES